MVILDVPQNTIQAQLAGKVYDVDISDFNVITKITELPGLQGTAPKADEMETLLEQYKAALVEILGGGVLLPSDISAAYFAARAALVALYWAIRDEQAKYLDINYRVRTDLQRRIEMSKMMAARGGADEGKPDASTD